MLFCQSGPLSQCIEPVAAADRQHVDSESASESSPGSELRAQTLNPDTAEQSSNGEPTPDESEIDTERSEIKQQSRVVNSAESIPTDAGEAKAWAAAPTDSETPTEERFLCCDALDSVFTDESCVQTQQEVTEAGRKARRVKCVAIRGSTDPVLTQQIPSLKHLQFFQCRSCGMDDEQGKLVFQSLTRTRIESWAHSWPALEQLDVSRNSLSSTGIQELTNALRKLPRMRILSLAGNAIGREGGKTLGDGLFAFGGGNLAVLDVSNCDLGTLGTHGICRAISIMKKLRVLDVSYNGIGNSGAESLMHSLSVCLHDECCQLRCLWLQDNGISWLSPVALHGLKTLPLETLDLSWNQLGNSGVECWIFIPQTSPHPDTQERSQVLSVLQSLRDGKQAIKTLKLDSTDISGEGFQDLADTMLQLPWLKKLSLNDNRLGESGCKALGPVLEELKGLQELRVQANGIGEPTCNLLHRFSNVGIVIYCD